MRTTLSDGAISEIALISVLTLLILIAAGIMVLLFENYSTFVNPNDKNPRNENE
jgi:hypothetical protein